MKATGDFRRDRRRRWIGPVLAFIGVVGVLFGPLMARRAQRSADVREFERALSTTLSLPPGSEDRGKREALGRRLSELGPLGLRVLRYQLRYQDPTWSMRRSLLWNIPKVGRDLANRASNPAQKPETVRRNAARFLGHMGANAVEASSDLIQAATDPSMNVRASVAYALGAIGSLAPESVETLEGLARSGDNLVRVFAEVALWRLHQGDDGSTQRLLVLLDSEDRDLSYRVAYAIRDNGPPSKPLIARIREITRDWAWDSARREAFLYVWATTEDVAFASRELDAAVQAMRERCEAEDIMGIRALFSNVWSVWRVGNDMGAYPELSQRLLVFFQRALDFSRSDPSTYLKESLGETVANAIRELNQSRNGEEEVE